MYVLCVQKKTLPKNLKGDMQRLKILTLKLYGIEQVTDSKQIQCMCRKDGAGGGINSCLLHLHQSFLACQGYTHTTHANTHTHACINNILERIFQLYVLCICFV